MYFENFKKKRQPEGMCVCVCMLLHVCMRKSGGGGG